MIVCLLGKSGCGKSSIEKELQLHGLKRIISTTTRPIREHEQNGVDYYYVTEEEYNNKLNNNDFLECTTYNNWHYGIDKTKLDLNNNDYVVVIEPNGYDMLRWVLCKDALVPIYVHINDKERLLRSLHREDSPDCKEICRRFLSDIELFKNIENDESIYHVENSIVEVTVDKILDYLQY